MPHQLAHPLAAAREQRRPRERHLLEVDRLQVRVLHRPVERPGLDAARLQHAAHRLPLAEVAGDEQRAAALGAGGEERLPARAGGLRPGGAGVELRHRHRLEQGAAEVVGHRAADAGALPGGISGKISLQVVLDAGAQARDQRDRGAQERRPERQPRAVGQGARDPEQRRLRQPGQPAAEPAPRHAPAGRAGGSGARSSATAVAQPAAVATNRPDLGERRAEGEHEAERHHHAEEGDEEGGRWSPSCRRAPGSSGRAPPARRRTPSRPRGSR